MLKGIDPLLTPELLMHLCAMGHGEWVAVVDANFTADYLSQGRIPVVRLPGHSLERVSQAVLSVMPLAEANVVAFDGWRLHRMERHLTSPTGVVLPLSNAEFRLLSVFVQHPRKLLTREQLLDEARGREADAFDRSIDLLVSRLRQKLSKGLPGDDGSGPEHLIRTVRGAGYLFQVQHVSAVPEGGRT